MPQQAAIESERAFLADNALQLTRVCQIIALVMPVGFTSLFPVDLLMTHLIVAPRTLFIVRCCIVLYLLLFAAVAFTPLAKRSPNALAVGCFASGFINIVVITVLTGGSASPYNVALFATIFMMATFQPWRVAYFAPTVLLCTATYPLALVVSDTLGATDAWVAQVGCLLIACGIGIVATHFFARLRYTAFISRMQLDKKTQDLDKKSQDLERALAVIQKQQHDVNADLDQAREFQQKILRPLPASADLDFAVLYALADFLGGDFYDVSELSPAWYRIFVVDVTGHGAQAAMRTMILQQQLERNRGCETPWNVLARMNDAVIAAFGPMSVNYCAICVDLRRNAAGWHFTGTNAGLPEPALVQQQALSSLPGAGAYQGVFESVEYPRIERQLAPGDGIVLATGGVVDLFDQPADSVWIPDGARFASALQESANAAVTTIGSHLQQREPAGDRSDDLTMLVLRIPAAGQAVARQP